MENTMIKFGIRNVGIFGENPHIFVPPLFRSPDRIISHINISVCNQIFSDARSGADLVLNISTGLNSTHFVIISFKYQQPDLFPKTKTAPAYLQRINHCHNDVVRENVN